MSRQFNRWIIPGVLLLVCLTGLAACSSSRPNSKMPVPAAPLIQVDGEALPALSFAEIILDIPHHVPMGYHYEGLEQIRMQDYQWSEHFENQTSVLAGDSGLILTEAGYRVGDEAEALRLVGTMARVSYNSYAVKIGFEQAECQMTWRLYRTGEKKSLFETVTNGAGRVEPNQLGAIRAAYELALRRLLANPEFVAAVSN